MSSDALPSYFPAMRKFPLSTASSPHCANVKNVYESLVRVICLLLGLSHALEEVNVGKLGHLLKVGGFDNLFVVEEDPC